MISFISLRNEAINTVSTIKLLLRCLLCLALVLLLTACGSNRPPLNYGPDRVIIKKAIAWQLAQRQHQLAEQLGTADPSFEIKKFTTEGIEPLYVKNLATYHFQGNFDYQLNIDRDRAEQKHQNFDLYLQRQREGKSWRILVPIPEDRNPEDQAEANIHHRWQSYLVP